MFESLKKKLVSWISGTPEKKAKKTKAVKEKAKFVKVSKTKVSKKSKYSIEKQLKNKADKIKVEVPLKFEPSELKYEPDTRAIKEKAKEIEKLEVAQAEEQVKEEQKQGFFARLTSKFSSSKITEQQFDELFYELELTLLESNVALEVVDKIREDLKKNLVGYEVKKDQIESKIISTLKESISDALIDSPNLIDLIKNRASQEPYKIIFFGINGSGKTTSVAKLAYYLKKHNISSVLAAGDTFRAASIEQLEVHANKLQVPIIKQTYNADPAAVAFDAIKYAKAHSIKVVLIDTAGRMYTRENLMKEMKKIIRVTQPDLKLFVGESITGNDATEQARTFAETVGIDGLILTKADVDQKGGTALSVSYITKKPIFFLGQGQTYDDLKPFSKQDILKNLGLD